MGLEYNPKGINTMSPPFMFMGGEFSHDDITTLNEEYEDQYGNVWIKIRSKIFPDEINRIMLVPWTQK